MTERAGGVHVPIALFVALGTPHHAGSITGAPRLVPPSHSSQATNDKSHSNALATLAAAPTPEALGVSVTPEAMEAVHASNNTVTSKCRALANADGYDGIVMELANARWRERWVRLCLQVTSEEDTALPRSSSRASFLIPPSVEQDTHTRSEAETWRADPHFLRSEVNITHANEARGVTALLSQWIELDALDEGVRLDAELALRQEMLYASYLGIQHVVLPAPSSDPERRPFLSDYARAVRACLAGVPRTMRVSVRIPVSSPHILATMLMRQALKTPSGSTAMPAAAYLRTNDNWAWETWQSLQTLCAYDVQLHVALDLSMPLPPATSMIHWTAEPVSLVWLPSSSFLANAKGFPVLSKSAQGLVRALLRRAPLVVLSDITTPPPQHVRGGPSAYLQYVRHLSKTLAPPSRLETFARGYGDWLQAPLQPLADDLGADTYDVFESDPVKYELYEEAIFQALVQKTRPTATVHVWVVGAGRGALVTRSLAAAERASRSILVTALEKNAGACIGLQDRQVAEWGPDRVRVVQGDMRTLPVPASVTDRADIVVSELLGSFADNELAPECLDGAMRFLKPQGVSIPSSYMPFIAPITTPKLHAALRNGAGPAPNARPGIGMGQAGDHASFDTPYVVLFESVSLLSALDDAGQWPRVQPCWRFEHGPMESSGLVCSASGLPVTNNHNVRTSVNTFYIPHAGVCHGLAGYFEAHLFGDVVLSIFPDDTRASPNMVSWFPMFFPLRDPLYVPPNSELEVHMWRLSDERRVWYEWSAEVFLCIDTPLALPSAPSPADDSRQLSASDILPPFTNAPHTPQMPSIAAFSGGPPEGASSVPSESTQVGVRRLRIKTGQTELMNANARCFSLTL